MRIDTKEVGKLTGIVNEFKQKGHVSITPHVLNEKGLFSVENYEKALEQMYNLSVLLNNPVGGISSEHRNLVVEFKDFNYYLELKNVSNKKLKNYLYSIIDRFSSFEEGVKVQKDTKEQVYNDLSLLDERIKILFSYGNKSLQVTSLIGRKNWETTNNELKSFMQCFSDSFLNLGKIIRLCYTFTANIKISYFDKHTKEEMGSLELLCESKEKEFVLTDKSEKIDYKTLIKLPERVGVNNES